MRELVTDFNLTNTMKAFLLISSIILFNQCTSTSMNENKQHQKMTEEIFWNLIGDIDWTKDDDSLQLDPVISQLAQFEIQEIREFDEILAEKLYQLDGKDYAENLSPEFAYSNGEDHFSEDFFLYVRCCVVANGQEYYLDVLKNPLKMPKEIDYEPLLYVAEDAYVKKTNLDVDTYYENWRTKFNYETYSNTAKWK